MTELEKFGKHVMAKCRDMVVDDYHKAKKSNKQDFSNIGDEELRNILLERSRFFKSLTPEQISALDKLILSTVDHYAFSLLREFQENNDSSYRTDTFDIVVNGKTSFAMERDLISGNLFGDYFIWIEQHSKYGTFQY